MLLACWMKVLQAVWVGEHSVYHHFVGLKKLDATQTLVLVHMPIGCVFTGSVLYVLKSWVLTRHSFWESKFFIKMSKTNINYALWIYSEVPNLILQFLLMVLRLSKDNLKKYPNFGKSQLLIVSDNLCNYLNNFIVHTQCVINLVCCSCVFQSSEIILPLNNTVWRVNCHQDN